MYTLMHPFLKATLIRRYSSIAAAAREVLEIYAHTGVWYMIVSAND